MQTPATGLRLAFAAFALLGSACTTAAEPNDGSRLAVVHTADDGTVQTVGSYDPESGELTFLPLAQDQMREHLADAGYSASVEHAGEQADVDFDDGVAAIVPELEDGDALELRVDRPGMQTLVLGRLELQEGSWRRGGNKVCSDDWLEPVVG